MRIGDVTLNDNTPSSVPSWQLFSWTKYRSGERHKENRFLGAVKPPDSELGWLPAGIGRDTILVASTQMFPTAEEAAEWLRKNG